MPINSALYLVFLAVGAAVYWLIPKRMQVVWLLLLGVLFCVYHSLAGTAVLLAVSLFVYVIAGLLLRCRSRSVLWLGIGVLVTVLCFYKYAFPFGIVSTSIFQMLIPIGISYVIFEYIHLLADVYRGAITRCRFFDVCSFGFFFPARSAGPIKRFDHFCAQLGSRMFETRFLYYGLLFIGLGYAQKILIADPLIPFSGRLQSPAQITGAWDALLHLYMYSIRIYADFAGLTNIAIGSSLLFGFIVPKNFAYPYLQPNIALFWRKWHMSLSDWARDYIYIPLGGNRVGLLRSLANLLIVMLVIGIWHGSTLNFVVWGAWHGIGLVVHRLWILGIGSRIPRTWLTYVLGMIVTFHFVTFGWLFFVTDSLADSLRILSYFYPA